MTPDEFLGRVRDLLPAIRERAARAEQLRRLPDKTFAEYVGSGRAAATGRTAHHLFTWQRLAESSCCANPSIR